MSWGSTIGPLGGHRWPTRSTTPATTTPGVTPSPTSVSRAGATQVRTINWGALVRESWGAEYYELEDVYEFTNDRKVKGR